MKFKITNKAAEWLKVEYEDGSFAQIPSIKGWSKTDWHHVINSYAPKGRVTSADEIPWNIGDEEDTTTDLSLTIQYSYENARWALYPPVETQLLAMYESRKGNDVPITNVDKTITDFDALIPEDDNKLYTQAEINELKKKLEEEQA